MFAATPYHTVVVSFDAVPEVVLIVLGDAVAGTAANLIEPLIAALLCDEVGPAPKPPIPSTRYPQVFAVIYAGVVCEPLEAVMLLPPDVIEEPAPVSASCSV